MDLNQDIGALAAELLGKLKGSTTKPGGGSARGGRLLSVVALTIPVVVAVAWPTYEYVLYSGLPSEYQQNLSAREQKYLEHAELDAQLSDRLRQINSSGGLFEEQREIEQFFSFIAEEVVSHRLDTKSFAQSEVVSPSTDESEAPAQDYYIVNPGAKLELSGEYESMMAFLQAIRDLDKEVLISSLIFGQPDSAQNDDGAIASPDLDLSLSLQVFRLVSAGQ